MNRLRQRLTALYTVTTGGILFIVILLFFLSSIHKTQNAQLEQFHLIWNSLSSRFLSANAFSHAFLAQTEADYHLVIHIRENGQAFLYPGAWTPPDSREWLIAQAREMAENEGVFMDRAPVSSTVSTSSLLAFSGSHGENYYAMVLSVPTKHGVKSLCAIAWIPSVSRALRGTMLYLALLFFLGLAGLWLVSRKFVAWSLIPVEESQKKQAQFIAAASHELRSPLAVLRSGIAAALSSTSENKESGEPDSCAEARLPGQPYSLSAECASPGEFLLYGTHFPTKQKKDTLLPLLDRECVRMSRLIDDMLLLASADAKTWKLQLEIVDMDTLLIDLLETFQPVCREKGIFLKLELPDASLPPIEGDAQRIRQILQILLDNACQFTPAGKSIILRAETDDKKHRIKLKVIDEGCGIAPEDRPYIFDRFYQADSARSDKQHFGLGLSIARELTKLHGGTIDVGEDEKGRCCFTVMFTYHTYHGR